MQLGLQYDASSMLKESGSEVAFWSGEPIELVRRVSACVRLAGRIIGTGTVAVKGSKGSGGGSFRVFLGQTAPTLFLALRRLRIVAAAVQPCGRVGSWCPRKGWASRWPEGAASLLVR